MTNIFNQKLRGQKVKRVVTSSTEMYVLTNDTSVLKYLNKNEEKKVAFNCRVFSKKAEKGIFPPINYK